ncbi:hypothetical protein QBC46DRAFT_45223 [Diplogelasinospora grovesii]|uniref:Uncharacterized protein n=1 Tax=Diplogelasinospora grovesii TaxID=303347 RepID=A0AAN6MY65_9PEZI|nr:hypothetical protein QBC46DRAFT_45223 [Diplogelasinospora grovesii]
MFYTHDHEHSHHGLLRSFRSHKSLRDEARSKQVHHRKPSDASSTTRSSTDSSRPSTSRTENSLDRDPLRLHPPMASACSPCGTHGEEDRRDHRQHFHSGPRESQSLRSFHDRVAGGGRSLRTQASAPSQMVIYEGFDFGFNQQPPPPVRREPVHSPSASWPTPSPNTGSYSDAATPGRRLLPEWGGEGDVVTPRPHTAVMDQADYFMKRGDWKRKGIVFAPQVPMAPEEECFDYDV